jgi:DNA-binding ferritin-like protein (Dps family)
MKIAAGILVAVAGAAGLGLLCTAASAQPKVEQACAADIKTYCANVPEGDGRIAQCLKSNQQKLSPACQQGMANAAALMKEVVAACGDDLHRFCAGAAPGSARDCLKTNFRSLSFQCKRELFEAKKGM